MDYFRITPDQEEAFHRDGYLKVSGLLHPEEADLLQRIARADAAVRAGAKAGRDAEGNVTAIGLWNSLRDDDLFSAIVRCRRLVDTMENLLGGEVYHYHHKMTMKEPYEGGAWEWHQDYGYWYNNGCLFPYMGSVMMAVDRSTRENGCLQVLRGSHHMGRIDHLKVGTQTGADLERVEQAMRQMELVYAELEPGDALFFHCNLLHRSDANRSPHPRWIFLACYNAARNNPYKQHHHPCYSPLEKWEDERVLQVARNQWERMQVAVTP